VYDSRPRVAKGLKPFEYSPADIPLYTPGARWGTLGEPIRKMQKPLAPAESEQHLVLPTTETQEKRHHRQHRARERK
jgi:hypothetical protein